VDLPKELLNKKNLKTVYCEDCLSFDRATRAYCFRTKEKCRPKKKACDRISFRPKEEEEKL
jgi:hypothetical protein